jgi:hypothetical protein
VFTNWKIHQVPPGNNIVVTPTNSVTMAFRDRTAKIWWQRNAFIAV